MGGKSKKVIIFKYGMLFYMIVAAGYLLHAGGKFHAALSFFKKMEIETDAITSMEFRYDKRFQKTLSHYRFFGNLYQADDSTPVPGLQSTDILGEECSQMVPQGICIAGDYMIVTAYDSGYFYKDETGKSCRKINPSVLYVLSNQNPKIGRASCRERVFRAV